MSDSLALDLLKVIMPAVMAIIVWQQRQISSNRSHLEKLLEKCIDKVFSDDDEN